MKTVFNNGDIGEGQGKDLASCMDRITTESTAEITTESTSQIAIGVSGSLS